MFCKNIARLAVARESIHVWQPLATAELATFLQNILWESCTKSNFKKCSLKKFLKILIFWWEYMEMCFHGNRISWGINHFFISLYSKNQPLSFICSSIMLAPVISTLDEIYCSWKIREMHFVMCYSQDFFLQTIDPWTYTELDVIAYPNCYFAKKFQLHSFPLNCSDI